MQSNRAGTQQNLPKFFIPIQVLGVALVGVGLFALHSNLGKSIVNAAPALADTFTDWVLVGLGAFVLICNGLRLARRAKKHQAQGVALPVNDAESG